MPINVASRNFKPFDYINNINCASMLINKSIHLYNNQPKSLTVSKLLSFSTGKDPL